MCGLRFWSGFTTVLQTLLRWVGWARPCYNVGTDHSRFLENEIVGEALIALKHDELKEMGIASVGHRLTILKSVYDTKVRQDVPVDPDHYIPLCKLR